MIERRVILRAGLATLLGIVTGCGGPQEPIVPPPTAAPRAPLKTSPLTTLVASAGLRWVLVASPRALLGVPWIPPLVDLAVSGARFDRFAQVTGVDLRALPEAVIASSAPVKAASTEALFYLARHSGDPALIERSFRARLTGSEKRSVDRPDLVRISGKIGRETHAAVLLGGDVAGFQEGGSASRGPAQIAALFAEGKLKNARPALATEPLSSLALRLGSAPLTAFAPGPFEGDLARGLRGLLGGATALGATLTPSARQGFVLAVAVAGDFSASGTPAATELLAAWNDLAASSFGHMLALDAPLDPPAVSAAPDAVLLRLELSGRSLAEGLAKATASRVEDIFR